MMCQCRFTDYNKCITVVQGVDGGDAVGGGVGRGLMGTQFSAQFGCERKTAL